MQAAAAAAAAWASESFTQKSRRSAPLCQLRGAQLREARRRRSYARVRMQQVVRESPLLIFASSHLSRLRCWAWPRAARATPGAPSSCAALTWRGARSICERSSSSLFRRWRARSPSGPSSSCPTPSTTGHPRRGRRRDRSGERSRALFAPVAPPVAGRLQRGAQGRGPPAGRKLGKLRCAGALRGLVDPPGALPGEPSGAALRLSTTLHRVLRGPMFRAWSRPWLRGSAALCALLRSAARTSRCGESERCESRKTSDGGSSPPRVDAAPYLYRRRRCRRCPRRCQHRGRCRRPSSGRPSGGPAQGGPLSLRWEPRETSATLRC